MKFRSSKTKLYLFSNISIPFFNFDIKWQMTLKGRKSKLKDLFCLSILYIYKLNMSKLH